MPTTYLIRTTLRKWRPSEPEVIRPRITAKGVDREEWVADRESRFYVFRGRALTQEEFQSVMASPGLVMSWNAMLHDARTPSHAQTWTVEVIAPAEAEKEERKAAAKKRAVVREAALERVGE